MPEMPKMPKMIVSLIGGSGSGKDTQAKLLSERYHIPALSVGSMARKLAAAGDTEAITAMSEANQGTWFNDDYVNHLLTQEVKEGYENGFFITGYPRSQTQAETSDAVLGNLGKKLDLVIHIDVPAEIMLTRMRTQAQEDLSREDSSTRAMLHRILSYIETIEPVLKFFEAKGNLRIVDGALTIPEVNQKIVKILDDFNANTSSK